MTRFRRLGRGIIVMPSPRKAADTLGSTNQSAIHLARQHPMDPLFTGLDDDDRGQPNKMQKTTTTARRRRKVAVISPTVLDDDCVNATSASILVPYIPDFEDADDDLAREDGKENQELQSKALRIRNKRKWPMTVNHDEDDEDDDTAAALLPPDACGWEDEIIRNHHNFLQGQADDSNVKVAANVLLGLKNAAAFDPHTASVAMEPRKATAIANAPVRRAIANAAVKRAFAIAQVKRAPAVAPVAPARVAAPGNQMVVEYRPNRLAGPEDLSNLIGHHCLVRSDLLELFTVKNENGDRGRVGLRCVFCGRLPRQERAAMSIFFPKTVKDIYTKACLWQSVHIHDCKHIPASVRQVYNTLKENKKGRGKISYWVDSARRMGLADMGNDEGIYFPRSPDAIGNP